ncbi:YciI family protein [Desertimonas flava]|uniref:YciI family protein n=1 Tax=Desertimonas flava TaxID=2064846 RepID=UPI003C6CC295
MFVVHSTPTDLWPPSDDELAAHIEFIQQLNSSRTTFLSGPLLGKDDAWDGNGVTAIRAESLDDAIRIMTDEPLALAGRRQQTIHRWAITSGCLTISLSVSDAGTRTA